MTANQVSIERVFLGWDQPCLRLAARHLMSLYEGGGTADMGNLLLVLPGRRAIRRLTEILLEEGEVRRVRVFPPTMISPGGLPETLYIRQRPLVGDLHRKLLWVEALQKLSPAQLAPLLSNPDARRDLLEWFLLAEQIDQIYEELSGAGLSFKDVAEHCRTRSGFMDDQRWSALDEVYREYRRCLEARDLEDLHLSRQRALAGDRARARGRVYLIGVLELNKVSRDLLQKSAPPITALIHAPSELEAAFDELGCLTTNAWLQSRVDLEKVQVEILQDAAAQARRVLSVLLEGGARLNLSEATLGALDPEVAPLLVSQFESYGITVHDAGGISAGESGVARFLKGVGLFLERRSYADFAALVRQSAVQGWIRRHLHEDESAQLMPAELLTLLDEYFTLHLPAGVDELPCQDSRSAAVRRVVQALDELTASLRGGPRDFGSWIEGALEAVQKLYESQPLSLERYEDQVIISGAELLQGLFEEVSAVPVEGLPQLEAPAALRLMIRRFEREQLHLESSGDRIDLVGWLELQMDDAPHLIMAGFNDGFVPQALNFDPFLPNSLRQELGLLDNDRRYARDLYALKAIVSSRPRVQILMGRSAAGGERLSPSRLWFACGRDEIARRVLRYYENEEAPEAIGRTGSHSLRVGRVEGEQHWIPGEIPLPQKLSRPVGSMAATSFRSYLECPYRFYLKHVLRLRAIDDDSLELDPLGFGILAHEVLSGIDPAVAGRLQSQEQILSFLEERLDHLAAMQFGQQALPAVYVQLSQLRARLANFAAWQAKWIGEGWKVWGTEVPFSGGDLRLSLDPGSMEITGRIDRIDYHPGQRCWAIIDYKTGDNPDGPEKAHRVRGEWVDLQLPLYKLYLKGRNLDGDQKFGYIMLDAGSDRVRAEWAEWSPEDDASAMESILRAARAVRDGIFWPPRSLDSRRDEYGAVCALAPQLLADGGQR